MKNNNMEKQTAVEWLIENIYYLHSTKWNDIIEQAKVMEKEQIISAYRIGCEKTIVYEIEKQENDDAKRLTSKGYYNETYKQEE
jgi:uncharacterized metal-binding protein